MRNSLFTQPLKEKYAMLSERECMREREERPSSRYLLRVTDFSFSGQGTEGRTDEGREGGRANFLSPSVCCHDRELLPREEGRKSAGYGGAETISDEHVPPPPPPTVHASVLASHLASRFRLYSFMVKKNPNPDSFQNPESASISSSKEGERGGCVAARPASVVVCSTSWGPR